MDKERADKKWIGTVTSELEAVVVVAAAAAG